MKTKLFVFVLILMFSSEFVISQSKKVEIETTKGTMTVMLYDGTPEHRDNFLKLVESGFYEGLLFHRVIEQFMIQGGDPLSKDAEQGKPLGQGGPGYTLPAEIKPEYFHKYGALAAARLGDNANPERRSSGSQFYLVQGRKYTDMQLDSFEQRMGIEFTTEQRDAYNLVGGAPHLDGQYTVFGEVVEGLRVIDIIGSVETGRGDRPKEDVKIIKMRVVE